MIEVTVLYHEENDEEESAKELYDTICLLINDEFPELEYDEEIIIEIKEFNE